MSGLLHLVQRGRAWAGCGPAQSPPRCTKCNSPPINGQCTNRCIAISWSVVVRFNVSIKGLKFTLMTSSTVLDLHLSYSIHHHSLPLKPICAIYLYYLYEEQR